MLTGRTLNAEEGHGAGATQYLVDNGKGLETAMALAAKAASNTAATNFAVMHALPRIADSSPASGLFDRIADGGDCGNERRSQGAAQGLSREARGEGHAAELAVSSADPLSASAMARMEDAHQQIHRDHSAMAIPHLRRAEWAPPATSERSAAPSSRTSARPQGRAIGRDAADCRAATPAPAADRDARSRLHPASRLRNAASPASDTLAHCGSTDFSTS